MKYCVSTYMKVLKNSMSPSSTQVKLGNVLLSSLTNDAWITYPDATVSDWVNGKKNLGSQELEMASLANPKDYSSRFKNKVLPLLDSNKLKITIATIRKIIALDESIDGKTVVELVNGQTKEQIVSSNTFVASDFLAGVFLYAIRNTDNRGTTKYAGKISTDFIASVKSEADEILLADNLPKYLNSSLRIWSKGSNSIEVSVGDIFSISNREHLKEKTIVVIPVEVTFSVSLSDSLEGGNSFDISEKTLHGKWLKRMQSLGIDSKCLSVRIENELNSREPRCGSGGIRKIGSIAIIEEGCAVYCLLAVSVLDEKGNTHATKEDILVALESLLNFYDEEGMGYPIFIPLVGTGRSRAGLGHQESFDLILNTLLKNEDLIQGEVHISLTESAFNEVDIEKSGDSNAL